MAHNNDSAIKFAMGVLEQMPKADKEQMEDHMTAVLLVFWSALWGSFGTDTPGDSSRPSFEEWKAKLTSTSRRHPTDPVTGESCPEVGSHTRAGESR